MQKVGREVMMYRVLDNVESIPNNQGCSCSQVCPSLQQLPLLSASLGPGHIRTIEMFQGC